MNGYVILNVQSDSVIVSDSTSVVKKRICLHLLSEKENVLWNKITLMSEVMRQSLTCVNYCVYHKWIHCVAKGHSSDSDCSTPVAEGNNYRKLVNNNSN